LWVDIVARQIDKLSALTVSKVKKKGYYPDGQNLYLQVVDSGAKTWIFRYMLNGKSREMGLGGVSSLTLADARVKAAECRKLLNEGIDPIAARNIANTNKQLAAAKAQTFRQCAEAYIDAHKAGWRNEKHIWQWGNTLQRFAYPIIGDLPVQDVDVTLVLKILEQKIEELKGKKFWEARPETASRVRGRIEVILDWATSREYRRGENPARWRGHLENLLPKRSKVQVVVHQAALPYEHMENFMAALKKQEGIAALAMAFTILTATRTSEVIGAMWKEIDLQGKIWTIPANRIKAGREHRVPLSEPALHILKEIKKQHDLIEQKKSSDGSGWIFTGQRQGKPISNTAMLMLLRRMKKQDITVHGFRSSFRDWAAEQTHFAREVAEMALAHAIGDKVEAAYRRGDLFEKRTQLMDAWARYCATPSAKVGGKVLPMRSRK
jgi:integrase